MSDTPPVTGPDGRPLPFAEQPAAWRAGQLAITVAGFAIISMDADPNLKAGAAVLWYADQHPDVTDDIFDVVVGHAGARVRAELVSRW